MHRRKFTQFVLGSAAQVALGGGIMQLPLAAFAQSRPKPNSVINGVAIGLQPFCYHDLAVADYNRSILIDRMVQNGLGIVELHAGWVEPNFRDGVVSTGEAVEKLKQWRLATPLSFYQKMKGEFDRAGITIFSYYVNVALTNSPEEIDAIFEGAKALGAKGVVGSYGQAVAARLAPFPAKHGMFAGLHNHDNLSDPDSFSNEESFIKGLALSPDLKATLDVRHFTAANGDCLGFLERHHDRVSSVHLGDRRRNNGHSTPFGQGDAPIVEILRMIRDNQWPIVALLEFEHGTLRTGVEEVQVEFDYCKRALA
jgi:sugar phosphate isomerase/epimerase